MACSEGSPRYARMRYIHGAISAISAISWVCMVRPNPAPAGRATILGRLIPRVRPVREGIADPLLEARAAEPPGPAPDRMVIFQRELRRNAVHIEESPREIAKEDACMSEWA